MDWFVRSIDWISKNESSLSGLAALVVVAGVVISPLGVGIRRLFGLSKRRHATSAADTRGAKDGSEDEATLLAPGPPSIAVLPFSNLSDDSEQAYLAEGMTEDIITGLAAIPRLSVAARNSTSADREKPPDIRDIGRTLGVRYILEGSVRRIGRNIRVTAQLAEADQGKQLWANRYDRPYSAIFDVQDDLVADIAGALSLQITQAEIARARTAPPTDPEAWELVTQVMHSHFRQSSSGEGNREMLGILEKAVSLDGEYAYARAAYAWLLISTAINGYAEDPHATFKKGCAQLEKALELDVSDALTQFYVGAAYLYRGRFEKACRFLEKSLASNPHQPDALVHLALARAYCGDFDRAYADFDRAARMGTSEASGGFYTWYRGIALALQDRYEEAIAVYQDVLERHHSYQTPRCALGVAYAMIGETETARATIAVAHAMDPTLNVSGLAMHMQGHFDPEKGRARAEMLLKLWPESGARTST